MSSLRDPFAIVHKKDIKNKAGEVVAQVDYVGWSQVADRLDEAAPGWSFTIRQLGADWCWGQLTIDGRTFDNIGYAENADAAWKKEPLKDAVSDAMKRCAALAGVARYLYDKDARPSPASPPQTAQVPRSAPSRPTAPPRPMVAADDDMSDIDWDAVASVEHDTPEEGSCPVHHVPWVAKPAGVSKNGSPYDAFWSCGVAGPPWCKSKPSKAWNVSHPA